MKTFPTFDEYDMWWWLTHFTRATREQYESAKARAEVIVRKAEAI